jgi:hypothetical protein
MSEPSEAAVEVEEEERPTSRLVDPLAPIRHDDLVAALANRYSAPHWLLFDKVHDCPGFDRSRTADAVAFGLYHSRGFEVHGFEAKVDRGDFLREIADPDKADWLVRSVDRFYIVAPGPEVAKASELPVRWGLLYVKRHGDGFRVKTARVAEASPSVRSADRPLDRPFVASLLVRMQKRCASEVEKAGDAQHLATRLQEQYEAGIVEGKRREHRDEDREEREVHNLRRAIEAFEVASGVRIREYDGPRLGEDFGAFRRAREALGRPRLDGSFGTIEQILVEALDAVRVAREKMGTASAALDGGETP